MKSLVCVVIGDGSPFVVEIEDKKKVALLKDMIKEKNSATIKCDAKHMTLYIAKKGNKWLTTGDPDVTMLESGEVPIGITDIMKKKENKMDPMYRIGNAAFNFPSKTMLGKPKYTFWSPFQKGKIEDDESSMVYSDVSFEDVDKIMPADHYKQKSKDIGDDKIDAMYSYLLVVTKAFGEFVTGAEAKRLHLIFPMLAYVCELFDGDAQMLAEEIVEGKRVDGDGKFEFVIKCGSKRLNIVVAKKNDMAQGLAQAYVGSEILSDIEGLSTVYSIVTNFTDWYFCRVTDDRVERDFSTLQTAHDIPARGSVKKIAEKIYAMLSEDE